MRTTTRTWSIAGASAAALLLAAASAIAASNEQQQPNARSTPQQATTPCVTSDCTPARESEATAPASAEPRNDYASASMAAPAPKQKRPKVDPRAIEEFQRLNPGG